jgi:hypothetical protein
LFSDVALYRWQRGLAGLGGAFLTLAHANQFVEIFRRGFIACHRRLARWSPIRVFFVSLLFGLFYALQLQLQADQTYSVSSATGSALPLTIVALMLARGRSNAPSMLGVPCGRDRISGPSAPILNREHQQVKGRVVANAAASVRSAKAKYSRWSARTAPVRRAHEILCGVLKCRADSVQGQPLKLGSCQAARLRIGMVHQHFMLVPNLSWRELCSDQPSRILLGRMTGSPHVSSNWAAAMD